MTTAEATSPGDLIRWRYGWYVAAALAVMIVAIVSGYLWLLNFVHVFTSLVWTGIDLFIRARSDPAASGHIGTA